MAPARLSLHVCATFLSFFSTTAPQLSRNFCKSLWRRNTFRLHNTLHTPHLNPCSYRLLWRAYPSLTQLADLPSVVDQHHRCLHIVCQAAHLLIAEHLLEELAKTRSHRRVDGPLPRHRNFRATFGLSRPYRTFRKNFRESLPPPNLQ